MSNLPICKYFYSTRYNTIVDYLQEMVFASPTQYQTEVCSLMTGLNYSKSNKQLKQH